MNKNFLIHTAITDRHDPILSATVFPHDAIHQSAVSITLGVDHPDILTSGHSSENLTQVVVVLDHFLFLCVLVL
jgi:hypothetical protein